MYAKLTVVIKEVTAFVRHLQDIKVCEGWKVKVSQLFLISSTKNVPIPMIMPTGLICRFAYGCMTDI